MSGHPRRGRAPTVGLASPVPWRGYFDREIHHSRGVRRPWSNAADHDEASVVKSVVETLAPLNLSTKSIGRNAVSTYRSLNARSNRAKSSRLVVDLVHEREAEPSAEEDAER